MKPHSTILRQMARRGGTMVEIVIVTLIFGIMMAVGASMFFSAQSESSILKCRANMMTIGNLEQEYKVQSSTHSYTTTVSSLSGNVPAVPVCPSGGTYSVTISTGTSTASNGQNVPAGKLLISCSATGHGVYAPDIDTN